MKIPNDSQISNICFKNPPLRISGIAEPDNLSILLPGIPPQNPDPEWPQAETKPSESKRCN
jgi:hypothetical protein